MFSGLVPPKKKKLFRFAEMWLSNPECSEIFQAVWNRGGVEFEEGILHRVDKCGRDFKLVE